MPAPTILIPLDGSKLAETSLLYLDALRSLGPFEVELIHVDDPEAEHDFGGQTWNPGAYVTKTAAGLAKRCGLTVRALSPAGTPYAEILSQAENPWVSMILTTTHGRTGYERWAMGSVADKVVRGAPCPVMAVGPATRGAPASVDRILVPLDGSPLAEEALPFAKGLAQRLGSGLLLIRAVTPRTVPDELAGSLSADLVESYEQVAGKYLEEVRLELETAGTVDTAPVTGPATEVILTRVDDEPCQLVVMTSHGRHGFIRFALGSVTQRVLEASAAPVLIVRPGQWQRFEPLIESRAKERPSV
jgi:nucleotide-binding universal stress UspA family protein